MPASVKGAVALRKSLRAFAPDLAKALPKEIGTALKQRHLNLIVKVLDRLLVFLIKALQVQYMRLWVVKHLVASSYKIKTLNMQGRCGAETKCKAAHYLKPTMKITAKLE